MTYQIIIPKPVQKELDQIPNSVYIKIIKKLQILAENPRPHGVIKLQGYDNEYRLRIGDYRVRYEIKDKQLIILLLRCQHRKDIYRE